MRRLIICTALILTGISSYAQNFKLGIQLSPAISVNRVDSDAVDAYISRSGTTLKMRFGPIADFGITDTYFFTTGILFAPKGVVIEYNDGQNPSIQKEEYKLQFLQVPIALKLFTNEIMLDTKIYVKMGAMTEFAIGEKQAKNYASPFINDFTFFDTSLLLGTGVEYAAGTNTVIFAGLSYNRGLINTISKYNNFNNDKLKIHNDLFNLDLGVKF